ncbi:MAG TPA: glycosyltransferase [Acetobacteraceae bacterium]|nr:glycosyltransferase [Acetobacteraceae bacterium]
MSRAPMSSVIDPGPVAVPPVGRPLGSGRSRQGAPLRIAVLIPCYNEALSIAEAVAGFATALPAAAIYVYDNNSDDDTATIARRAGAIVRHEGLRGKGNVVRRMFADIEAEIYILVDGDGTYDPAAAPAMVELLLDRRLDMVTATRVPAAAGAYRAGHQFGNALLTGVVRTIFGRGVSDMLSGYRAFSRRFVKSFPALAAGFETETEFTVHALELRMPIGEVPTPYGERPPGSVSKLRTYADGLRILRTILVLVKEERPLQFFSATAALLLVAALAFGVPVISGFLQTGLVPRLPTAVLATGLVLLSCLSATCGLILDSVTRGRRELKRLSYLAIPSPAGCDDAWPTEAPPAPFARRAGD